MTHKLIMLLSLLPPFPPCCLSLPPSLSLSRLPPLLLGVPLTSHLRLTRSNPDHTWMTVGVGRCVKCFLKWGGGTVENSWEKQENIDNDLALTSKQLQLYTFGACCYSAIPGAFLKASGIHSAVGTRLLHPGWCWIEEGGERGRMASVRKHWINC